MMMEFSGSKPGALVVAGSAFSRCPAPGRKKSIGETLWLALIPLQPVPASDVIVAASASSKVFQFNLTCPL